MSLLNISFLNEAINEEELVQPNEVFNHVRQRLIENISQDGGKDGMDGILISLKSQVSNSKSQENSQVQISYAAAHNAPILIRNGELTELEADKMPVGAGDNKDSFTHYSLPQTPPLTGEVGRGQGILYLYTDGFADQFGGPKGKKFKYKPLNDLLSVNSSKPMAEQKLILEKTFEDWKGNLEQVDDVLIIGIKV
ncbi:MAG: SpoIIE family protein phosphatase [Bacteroidetes bacterium]|nr:SpoIIE family protein phosphatase [Bacteroidota bacterium]